MFPSKARPKIFSNTAWGLGLPGPAPPQSGKSGQGWTIPFPVRRRSPGWWSPRWGARPARDPPWAPWVPWILVDFCGRVSKGAVLR